MYRLEKVIKHKIVGHGGALVEATSFDRRVLGSNPTLAAM